MKLHVLPGDSTVEGFRQTGIDGEIVVCRECLIEGDVRGESLDEFWDVRARYLENAHPRDDSNYRSNVAAEFEKLLGLSATDEVNLWFEYELFCQTNMWFCLSLLSTSTADVFRIAPITLRKDETWDGFGSMTTDDLKSCFDERIKFGREDLDLGVELWQAYRDQDHARLAELAKVESSCFPYLEEVCAAEIEKATKPKQILRDIQRNETPEFDELFKAFRDRAGVYGFGDLQVKRILQEI